MRATFAGVGPTSWSTGGPSASVRLGSLSANQLRRLTVQTLTSANSPPNPANIWRLTPRVLTLMAATTACVRPENQLSGEGVNIRATLSTALCLATEPAK